MAVIAALLVELVRVLETVGVMVVVIIEPETDVVRVVSDPLEGVTVVADPVADVDDEVEVVVLDSTPKTPELVDESVADVVPVAIEVVWEELVPEEVDADVEPEVLVEEAELLADSDVELVVVCVPDVDVPVDEVPVVVELVDTTDEVVELVVAALI